MDINQKNVVYIGGSGGIGSMTCKLLVQKKVANLAILDLIENVELIKELEALNASTNVFFLKIDVRCKKIVKKCLDEVVAKIGHIDILVNGSGLFNEVDVDLNVGVNLLGVMHSSLIALELMSKTKGNRGGTIVNISSVAGLDPSALLPVYCASKAGVLLFTRSLGQEAAFAKTGVSFITICPGITRTALLDQFTSVEMSPQAQIIAKSFDLIKNQSPEECANSILKVIEMNKNGAAYACDVGEIKEIHFQRYWDIQK